MFGKLFSFYGVSDDSIDIIIIIIIIIINVIKPGLFLQHKMLLSMRALEKITT